ncbi:MAG: succinylglutamate desuccinylase/aspartoacylase family protein [Methanobacteriaceae archaeon]|nr:succinylglutamate desuccinylase/aspartoacylase family protein [Methanobacteriaceae archaeon]
METFEIDADDRFSNFELEIIYSKSGGFISANKTLFNNLNLSDNIKLVLEESIKGTVMLKIGNGSPKVMIVAGVHGNELSPQIASSYLIDYLLNTDINGTVYIVPFASPKASMDSSRRINNIDANRSAHKEGTNTNAILNKALELKVSALGDFHSTAPNTNPGREGVFASKEPSTESLTIAEFIANKMDSDAIKYNKAGIPFKGALEDEVNLAGIPSVTCEVFAPVSFASEKHTKRSFMQMLSFLEYFGIIDELEE